MKIDKYRLYYKTQSIGFLTAMVSIIIIVGLIASTILNSTKTDFIETKSTIENLKLLCANQLTSESYKKELAKELKNPKLDLEEFVNFIEDIAIYNEPKITEATITQLELAQTENTTFTTFSLFLYAQSSNNKLNEFIAYSKKVPTTNYSNRLLSSYYWHKHDNQSTVDYLKLEPTLKESESCKKLLVHCLIELKNIEELEILEKDPAFEKQNDQIVKAILLEKKTWGLLFKSIVKSELNVDFDGIFFLTLLTGIIWFGIWIHALKSEKFISSTIIALFAFALGVFSTSITVFIIYIEEDLFNLRQGDSLISGLLYFIIGVGLREEFSKIIVFTILIPILIKRKNALEWLIMPGIVGLGFATEENLNYFLHDNTVVIGRFLMTSFGHLAMTALIGESLCYYFYNRTKGLEHFISTFSMIVIMHGVYDACISVDELKFINIVSSILFIYSAYLFFGRLKELRPNSRESISLTTHFIFGITFLFMSTFVYFSYQGGHFFAFQSLTPTILESLVFIYMFLYVMPNSIIKL
jgi:RsiW-degrading membrane proteinase PrsW (M82 family)